jgi:fructosamine-3-kinase
MALNSDDTLSQIQHLQFHDKPRAEERLAAFVRELFPMLAVKRVELRPLAVSLNSFNGFLTLDDDRRLFFKTHVEPDGIISEYYNTELLISAGYPVIRPLYTSTEFGKQFLIYELIESPSVFDAAYAAERGQALPGADFAALEKAQHAADDQLRAIYLNTLAHQSADGAAKSPVHQLFFHRLGARYQSFYAEKPFHLPGGTRLMWEDLLARRWVINGEAWGGTLGAALDQARVLLRPDQPGWSVVGHGDAHNGNVFLTPGGLVYFDPAFAGRHHPALDLAKPLFHNVFARWMYHPAEIAATLGLDWRDDGATITVEHDFTPTPLREMFFASKSYRVYEPIREELKKRGESPGRMDKLLAAAGVCCPLLTMNLADRTRFPAEIALLGLCDAVMEAFPLA